MSPAEAGQRLPAAPEGVGATVTKLLAMADELLATGDTDADPVRA